MEKLMGCKVFKVDLGGFGNYRYVIAKGFDEAAEKVILKLEHEKTLQKNILDSDGSLITESDKPITIKGVEQLSDEIIF